MWTRGYLYFLDKIKINQSTVLCNRKVRRIRKIHYFLCATFLPNFRNHPSILTRNVLWETFFFCKCQCRLFLYVIFFRRNSLEPTTVFLFFCFLILYFHLFSKKHWISWRSYHQIYSNTISRSLNLLYNTLEPILFS